MKKTILLITSIAVSLFYNAQIDITNADFATGGDTVRMSQASDNGYDYLSTGAGYVWDFSALTADAQILKDFLPTADAPTFIQYLLGTFAPLNYQSTYYIESTAIPIAEITSFLPVTIDNIYQFTRLTVDSATSVGFSMSINGNNIPFKSDTIETRYDFPLQFGNTHFSRGYTFIDFNPIVDAVWVSHRTRTTVVDGYGMITTPYGTFNALRIKHDIIEIDSLYMVLPIIGGTWIPLPIPPSHEYEWWTNNEKEPILKFITSDIMGNETITAIEYKDIYLGLDAGISELEIEFNIYPNPAVNELTISTIGEISSVKLIDSKGSVVFEKSVSHETSVVVDVAKYPVGVYQIEITSGSKTGVKSFVKR